MSSTAKAYSKPSYRYLVLGVLTLVYVSNFVDRQVINVLAKFIIECPALEKELHARLELQDPFRLANFG